MSSGRIVGTEQPRGGCRVSKPVRIDPNKVRIIRLRVTVEQDRAIRAFADQAGLSLSDWMRMTALLASVSFRNPMEAAQLAFLPEDETAAVRVPDHPKAVRSPARKLRRAQGS